MHVCYATNGMIVLCMIHLFCNKNTSDKIKTSQRVIKQLFHACLKNRQTITPRYRGRANALVHRIVHGTSG